MMRRLEADGLVLPQAPLRGRIGQPSVPFALNPQGALSFRLKIGRRSTDVVLCDFLGNIIDRSKRTYAYPAPQDALRFVRREIAAMRARQAQRDRVIGVGIAIPFELWKWAGEVQAPPGALDAWQNLDVAAEVTRRTGLPAYVANDATAACGAELARMDHGARVDLLYLFIGSFIGGGVVLNGMLYPGRTGNAGALGSMPVPAGGHTSQLIQHASLITLEKSLIRHGIDVSILQHPDRDWQPLGKPLARWIETAATAIARAIVAGMSVIDFQLACIDGAVPRSVLAEIVARTRAHVTRADLQGLSPFDVAAGTIGSDARALGGAMLPLNADFACDPDVLLKTLGPAG
jgi:predicted NBD/HSP70 family sugar kinase